MAMALLHTNAITRTRCTFRSSLRRSVSDSLPAARLRANMIQATILQPEPHDKPLGVERRAVLVAAGAMGMTLAYSKPVLAKVVKMEVKDLTTKVCDVPQAPGVPGSSTYKARCFEIVGTVVNPTQETVQNADVYGVVLDATNDPVLRSGRVGAIEEVPPGESTFRLEITVASSQPTPLKLKAFKAQGFLGTVNRSGNPYDMDFEVGTYKDGNFTNV